MMTVGVFLAGRFSTQAALQPMLLKAQVNLSNYQHQSTLDMAFLKFAY